MNIMNLMEIMNLMQTMNLYDYQQTGKNFLKNRLRAGLFDDPGLGKSAQVCVAVKDLQLKQIIIICPASAKAVWERELAQWGVCRDTVEIQSYEGAVKHAARLVTVKADLVVLDEAHYLKSPKAKRTKAIYNNLVPTCERVWVLTGTPMPNNPAELYTMFRAVFPDAIYMENGRAMNYWQFVNKYCTTQHNGFGIKITGGKNLGELRDRLTERTLRRKKEKVLKELPPMRHLPLPVSGDLKHISEEDMELFNQALTGEDPLGNLARMGGMAVTVRRLTGVSKVPGVVRWCKDNTENYKKVVIFAHHKEVIAALAKQLPNTVTLSGDTSPAMRAQAVERFQNDPDVHYFIGQIQSAGTAITLTAAHVVLFAEFSWVPAENEQAANRIHRIGQNESCLAYYAMISGSIDEKILKAVEHKRKTIKQLGL